ncbi:NAD(P)-dependent oxidoreductase [Streptomyces sp. NPDC087420]|uniref:NAD(P)-dependent oxidoreductase n=1 Tax=Streptomyces sp. NPDC087420 TaxID=3365785 RepID=UPI0038377B8C
MPTADALILCAPLTDEKQRIIDGRRLALLKDGALVVNVGRGELLDTDALVRELERGRLRAALDVTDPEPLPREHPLWHLPGVLITPHTAAFTDAFSAESIRFLRRQPHSYARGEAIENVVLTAEKSP